MHFLNISKKNFTRFLYRQQFDIFGHKLMLENSNGRKTFAVRLYKFYHRFLDIKFLYKNTKQYKLMKFLIFSEIFFFAGKYALPYFSKDDKIINCNNVEKDEYPLEPANFFKENYVETMKNIIKDENSYFYRSNILDLGANILIISYLGKFINLVKSSAMKKIVSFAIILNLTCFYLNQKINSFIAKNAEIINFNVFRDSSFLSKMLICYTYFSFLDHILTSKKIGYKFISFERKPILFMLSFFFLAKFSNFLSLFTTNTINLTTPDGILSSLSSIAILNPLYLPLFIIVYFINPYSFFIWFGGKNKFDDEKIEKIYKKKDYSQKFITYLKYISLSTVFYGMDIYF